VSVVFLVALRVAGGVGVTRMHSLPARGPGVPDETWLRPCPVPPRHISRLTNPSPFSCPSFQAPPPTSKSFPARSPSSPCPTTPSPLRSTAPPRSTSPPRPSRLPRRARSGRCSTLMSRRTTSPSTRRSSLSLLRSGAGRGSSAKLGLPGPRHCRVRVGLCVQSCTVRVPVL